MISRQVYQRVNEEAWVDDNAVERFILCEPREHGSFAVHPWNYAEIATLFPQASSYLITLSGLFFALVFPSMVMILSARFQEHRAHVLGLVTSGGLLIFMLTNAAIGVFCEQLSVRYSYLIMVLCVGVGLLLRRQIERREVAVRLFSALGPQNKP